MKRGDFMKIKSLKDEDAFLTENLKVGDKFLYGENVVRQLETKKKGEEITYYKVIGVKSDGRVTYCPVITTLED